MDRFSVYPNRSSYPDQINQNTLRGCSRLVKSIYIYNIYTCILYIPASRQTSAARLLFSILPHCRHSCSQSVYYTCQDGDYNMHYGCTRILNHNYLWWPFCVHCNSPHSGENNLIIHTYYLIYAQFYEVRHPVVNSRGASEFFEKFLY